MITGQATLQKSQVLYDFAILIFISLSFLVGFSVQIIAVCYLLFLVMCCTPIQLIKTRCLLLPDLVVLRMAFYHSVLLLCSNTSFFVHLHTVCFEISKTMK